MRAGKLRHRVKIQAPEVIRDDTGDEIPIWATVATVWAGIAPQVGIAPQMGSESAINPTQIIAGLKTRITVRWAPWVTQVTAKYRILHVDTIYNVAGPPIEIDVGRRQFQIDCVSGVNRG